jgi:hypothetical protein
MPNQCSELGPTGRPWLSKSRFCSFGSDGAIRGAKIAVRSRIPMISPPTIAPGFLISLRHESAQRPPGAWIVSSWASTSAMLMSTGSSG